jgi:hypothetical protein
MHGLSRTSDSAQSGPHALRPKTRLLHVAAAVGSVRYARSVPRCGRPTSHGHLMSGRRRSAVGDLRASGRRRGISLQACHSPSKPAARETAVRIGLNFAVAPVEMALFAIGVSNIGRDYCGSLGCERDVRGVATDSGDRPVRNRGEARLRRYAATGAASCAWLAEPKLVQQQKDGPPPRCEATLRRGILRLHL